MNLDDFIKSLKKNSLLLVGFPALLAILVFYFTRNMQKEYVSSMMIYTGLASGYNVTSDGGQQRVDNNAVANAFDNIIATVKAKETLEEVSIRLLASHLLLSKSDPTILSEQNFKKTKEIVPDSVVNLVLDKDSYEKTVENLYALKNSSEINWVKNALNSTKIIYGIPFILTNLTVTRKGASDMLEVSFTAPDAGVTKQTLVLLADVFIKNYKKIKGGETEKVVAYFLSERDKSQARLKVAEEKMKRFGMENKIINYYEQTRFIADAQQTLINDIQKEKMNMASTKSGVATLDGKINSLSGMIKTNNELANLRQKLSSTNYQISHAEIENDKKIDLQKLKEESAKLKEEIKEKINEVYTNTYSKENIPRGELVSQWLDKMIELDQSRARLDVMTAHLADYDKVYKDFAPLGSTLKSLEREAEVAEKEYLEILHSLNVSQLMQQNIELSGNLKVIDPPFLPISAKSSKRLPLLLGSFIFGLVLIVGLVSVREIVSNKIKNPLKAELLTGLQVKGMFAPAGKQKNASKENILWNQLLNQIMLEKMTHPPSHVSSSISVLTVASLEGTDRATWCLELARKINLSVGPTLFMYPETNTFEAEFAQESFSKLTLAPYTPEQDFMGVSDFETFIQNKNLKLSKFKWAVILLPPLSQQLLPLEALSSTHVCAIIASAKDTWQNSTKHHLSILKSSLQKPPFLVLLDTDAEYITNWAGNATSKGEKISSSKTEA